MISRKIMWGVCVGSGVVTGLALTVLIRHRLAKSSSNDPIGAVVAAARKPAAYEVAEVVYDGGFASGWKDWGWGTHDVRDAGAARIRFADFGGIVLHHDELPSRFGALVFRFQAPASYGDFLQVSLKYKQVDQKALPKVKVDSSTVAEVDGWKEALIPWRALDPTASPFDRIVIEATRPVASEWVLLDKVVLTQPDASSGAESTPTRDAKVAIECGKPVTPIDPRIYGVAKETEGLSEGARRVGGNTTSRLNWDLVGVWNTGSDWFFENVKGTETGVYDWIEAGRSHGVKMAVTVPMLGWVAKDTTSVGFPISKLGPQRARDSGRPEAGDGFRPDGKPITPGPPTTTSVAVPPEVIKRWIEKVRQKDAELGTRGVDMYILDNEPDLWNTTHRDVHPDPVSYDELLDRTIRYGRAIREADPEVLIAGPASWGWTGYFFSAKDMAAGWHIQPDRRAHGGMPLLAWYLQSLATEEKKTGVRILDVVDVHFYPQSKGVWGNGAGTDPETSALRLRSTRALWDPTYKDESWIGEHINLIPRLKAWIEQNYPGRGISIGEWSFGAEGHISGGLAIAEALGRFGQQGITSAFYWFEVPAGTPAFQAFRAYRNFDGKGARFLDFSVPTRTAPGVSLFASRDESSSHIVAIALNLDPVSAARLDIDLSSCGRVKARRAFSYGPGSTSLTEEGQHPEPATVPAGTLREMVPFYSIKVIDLTVEPPVR